MLRLMLAVAVGRFAGRLSRLVGRGGSALPGLVAERIAPTTIERITGSLREGVVLVTGTNGKTTTTKLLVAALEGSGRVVVTNPSGSNLERGIATALLRRSSWRGRVAADVAVFEVDEAAMRRIAPRLSPRLVVITNLARDQLDRFGELDATAAHIASALEHAATAVVNADDPLVAPLAGAAETIRYGAVGEIRAQVPSDRDLYGAASSLDRPSQIDVEVVDVVRDGMGQTAWVSHRGGEPLPVRVRIPGVYNAYNAAAALAAAMHLGVGAVEAASAMEAMEPPFGRGQVIEHRGRRVVVLLVKNPTGFNQAIRVLADADPAPVLVAINDEIADGRDVSWLWDARVEELSETGHAFGAGGTRATDMALRFKYAGIECWVEPGFARALDRLVAGSREDQIVYVLPTYTAMLALLDLLLPGIPRHEAWT